MATINDIVQAVRELSFDRFPIPVLVLKAKAGHTVTNTAIDFKIKSGAVDVLSILYSSKPTQEELAQEIIQANFPLAYLGNFKGTSLNADLLYFTNASLANNLSLLRKNFYSQADITKVMLGYCIQILEYPETTTEANLPDILAAMDQKTAEHLSLWVALMMVDERRIADFSAAVLSGYFTDGSGLVMSGALSSSNVWNNGDNINVNIGSVFSLSDNEGDGSSQFTGAGANPTLPGADNVLEDWSSFWWKLFLWLRDKIEQKYGDYTFRKDSGMWSKQSLERPLNYRTYYDSWPFTLSSMTRNIIS